MGTPSVSQVIGMLDGGRSESFAAVAARITAEVAAAGRPDGHEPGCDCDRCSPQSAYRRRWEALADRGTHVHHLIAAAAAAMAAHDDPAMAAHDSAGDPATAACLETFAVFCDRYRPTWLYLEQTVRYSTPRSHAYVGTFDALAEIDCPTCGPGARCRWLLDYKTGALHVAAQSLQLAAYRGAQQLTTWVPKAKRFACPEAARWSCGLDAPHTHCPVCGETGAHRPYAQTAYYDEVVDGPMPRVAHVGVILADPDRQPPGTVAGLVELPASGDAHGAFLRLRDLWAWTSSVEPRRRAA